MLGLFFLAAVAYSARAAFSGSERDEAYASRVYHGLFPGSGGTGPGDPSRVAAFAAAAAAGTARGAYRRPVVLVVGDSLVQRGFETSGWVASLARAYARVADVVNRGYSGYNTRWVRELMTHEPDLFPPRRDVAQRETNVSSALGRSQCACTPPDAIAERDDRRLARVPTVACLFCPLESHTLVKKNLVVGIGSTHHRRR